MLLLRLWNYIRGYVIIIVKGYFLEKFINICIHRQIYLWDIKRLKDDEMLCKISIKGFKILRAVARKSKSKVGIAGKVGLPFVLSKYKRRKAFVIGILIFIASIYIMTSFVWSVEITGNKKLDSKFIEQKLEALGVRPGVLKYSIKPDAVVNNMMLDIKELAWIGITVKGTKVKVTVVEGVAPPQLVPKNIPCNIVARRDGVIKAVTAKTGKEMVKSGDTVVKGQVLITGVLKNEANKEEPPRYVHAMGTVTARTWYEQRCPVDTEPVEEERTGNKKDNYALLLFGKKINLFPGKIPFEEYDSVEIKKSLSIGKDMELPFGLIIYRNYEKRSVQKVLDLDTAKQVAADSAHVEIMRQIGEGAQVVKEDVKFVDDGNGNLTAVVTVECLEDIGVTEEIGGN